MLSRKSIEGHFGSRRGFIRHIRYSLLHKLGRYRAYSDIDWQSIDRLVFVCKGNICRSAFAEAVARKEGFSAVSCGIDTIENAPANAAAVRMAQGLGYDLSHHKTTTIQSLVIHKSDLLVAMEPLQAKFLERHLGVRAHYTLLGLWANPAIPYIHDPYGLGGGYFDSCFDCIEKSTREVVKHVDKRN